MAKKNSGGGGNGDRKRGTDEEIAEAHRKYEEALRNHREQNPKGGKDS